MCPFCGEELETRGTFRMCLKGCSSYIEGEDMTFDEVCESMDLIDDDYSDCPF